MPEHHGVHGGFEEVGELGGTGGPGSGSGGGGDGGGGGPVLGAGAGGDPLRGLFKDAAMTGQARARSVPAAVIRARGAAVRRTRTALVAAATCAVLAGTAAALVAVAPHGGEEVRPGGSTGSASQRPGPPTPAIRGTRSPGGPATTYPPENGATEVGGSAVRRTSGLPAYPATTHPRTTAPQTTAPQTTAPRTTAPHMTAP